MLRTTIVVPLTVLLGGLLWAPAGAAEESSVTGGGTATFGADLDGDGRIDGSQFGVGVVVSSDGSARGRFTCLMAGRSGFLGLGLMAVHGEVTAADISAGEARLSGTATVLLTRADHLVGQPVARFTLPFTATLVAGGPGEGTMQLTIHGAFNGAPGDTNPGDGNYNLSLETVTKGRITVH